MVAVQEPRISGALFLVALSALLYALSLMVNVLWFCSFVFLIPLFYAALYRSLSFWYGFVWGLIAYSIVLSCMIYVLKDYGQGDLRVFGFPLLVVYGACSTGVWFFLAEIFSQRSNQRVFSWLLSTHFYFWWIDRGLFIIFGLCEGNSLYYPLLPLMHRPWLLWSVQWISKYNLFLVLSLCAMLVACALKKRQLLYAAFSVVGFMLFFAGYWLQHKPSRPLWLAHVGVMQQKANGRSVLQQAQEITYGMMRLGERYPMLRLIVTPESFFQYPLNEYRRVQEMWHDNIVVEDIALCCGAYRSEHGVRYNSLFVMTNSGVQWHDKSHLLCFAEYVPPAWLAVPGVQTLFLKGDDAFAAGCAERQPIAIPYIGSFVPYLCSELLLSHKPCDSYSCIPIICLANDSWFSMTYMPRLMMWQSQLKALEWGRPLLYIAYKHSAWVDRFGSAYTIQS